MSIYVKLTFFLAILHTTDYIILLYLCVTLNKCIMYGNHFKFIELIHTDIPENNYPTTPEQLQNLSALWDELNRLRD